MATVNGGVATATGHRGSKSSSGHHQKGKASGVSDGRGEVVVYRVDEVYIYIPAELSAAGFELKIAGSVKIADKSNQFHLTWWPCDLTEQDVASLYSSQIDTWTVVDEIVEPPVVIDEQELQYSDYHGSSSLELPDSILPLPSEESKGESSQAKKQEGNVALWERDVVAYTKNSSPARMDAVNFPLSDLHCMREGRKGERSLTFFLKSGHELPTLYFHDGGTTGLLQALQRYIYLERDTKHKLFYYAKSFDKSKRPKSGMKVVATEQEDSEPPEFKKITPRGPNRASEVQDIIQGVVGNFVGITRAVRQHLLPEKQLLEARPGTENDEEIEEGIQTVVLSSPTPPTSPRRAEGGTPLPPGAAKVSKEVDPDASLITDFQLITDIRGKLPPRPQPASRQPPVTSDEWERVRDDWGRVTPPKEKYFRARVFAGGIDPQLRKEAWKYLLGYYPFEMTDIERMELREERERGYWVMKQQWQAFTPDQESRFQRWREHKHLINKDVLRTDRDYPLYNSVNNPKLQQLEDILRTYTMYNFDLGYVQGMSDLLAPLLVVMDNEVDAFWCFVGFMDMVAHHFEMSQLGMRNRLKQLRALLNITDPDLYQFLKDKECNNLYFCFRWLIVHFKREFVYEDIMALWEVIWTGYLSPDYSLFVALAILNRERGTLLNEAFDFSDILKHINELAKNIPVSEVLELAESLCYQMGSSPALPQDLGSLLVRPLPPRASLNFLPQAKDDTIICSPDSRAVPTN